MNQTEQQDLNACAGIVRRGDPDRFLATMAAPAAMRQRLFAIYAFNVEVARAPWVSREPMINQMRLQWWRDALDEIAVGGSVRRHEVMSPLAAVIDANSAAVLGKLIDARHWDIRSEPFRNAQHLSDHLDATASGLMWVAAQAVGATQGEAAIREVGYAAGLANWFRAVPDLVARGRRPLPDETEDAIAGLARDGLARLRRARASVPGIARHATQTGWRADRTLRTVAANPAAVAGGWLHISEFSRRTSLLWHVALGRP